MVQKCDNINILGRRSPRRDPLDYRSNLYTYAIRANIHWMNVLNNNLTNDILESLIKKSVENPQEFQTDLVTQRKCFQTGNAHWFL